MDIDTGYEILAEDNQSASLRYGENANRVRAKHEEAYGDAGMKKICSEVGTMFLDLEEQLLSDDENNNSLLVGKIQSGKTSNLEFLAALAFDNGFNLLVIFGGYDLELLKQTTRRFRKTFDIDIEDKSVVGRETPILFTTERSDACYIGTINAALFARFMENNIPIILTVLKRPKALNAALQALSSFGLSGVKALVIDDEGDQASPNIAREKAIDKSATYEKISELKEVLGDPLYCSVTATPQVNIFLDEISRLQPASVHLLRPGMGYCGAEQFHLQDNDFIVAPVEDNLDDLVETNSMPDSLKRAVRHFLIASCIMKERGVEESDMLIHMNREVTSHSIVYRWVMEYLESLHTMVEEAIQNSDVSIFCQLFEEAYVTLFSQEIRDEHPIDSPEFLKRMNQVLHNAYCVLQNGIGSESREASAYWPHCIYVGADLLQRGLTFSNLVTTYFTRWAKGGGNMDTNLQRARWFGYRAKYLDLCRMFTTDAIAEEFINLGYMENDLWSQLEAVTEHEMRIAEVVIAAPNETRQKPARRSAVNYSKLIVTNWIRQNRGTFDEAQLAANTETLEEELRRLGFENRSLARRDGVENCRVASCSKEAASRLFNSLCGIFDDSFDKDEILKAIDSAESIGIVRIGVADKPRQRTFFNDDRTRIKVLQQGRSASDKGASAYQGDAAAIAPEHDLTIQIHDIVPMYKDTNTGSKVAKNEFRQYMFAIHVPGRERAGFVRS